MRAGYPELWRNVGWLLRALEMVVKAPSQVVTQGKSKRTQAASEDGMVGRKPTGEVSCFLAKVVPGTALIQRLWGRLALGFLSRVHPFAGRLCSASTVHVVRPEVNAA